MGIKATFAAENDIPAEVKAFYKDDNGKFVLDVEGIDDHPQVRGVITANNANKTTRDRLKAQLDELSAKYKDVPDDFSADEWVSFKSGKPQKPDEALETLKTQHANQIAAIKKTHETELAGLSGKLSESDGYISRMLIDGGLKDAMLETGVNPDLLDGALASLRGNVKVIQDDKGARRAIVETDLGEVAIGQFVKEWAGSKGKAYLAKPVGSNAPGSGARPGGKSITRATFDGMNDQQRVEAMKNGLTIVD